jgi:hypothetical protein
MHLPFKFEVCKKFNKKKKLMKYAKIIKITPNLNKKYQIMWDGLKKIRTKNYIKNNSPSAFPRVRHSGKSVLKIVPSSSATFRP